MSEGGYCGGNACIGRVLSMYDDFYWDIARAKIANSDPDKVKEKLYSKYGDIPELYKDLTWEFASELVMRQIGWV